VVNYAVYERRIEDQALLLPAISAHKAIFGKPPRLTAADRGFWSAKNKREAKAAGVATGCASPPRGVSPWSNALSSGSVGFAGASACKQGARAASVSSNVAMASADAATAAWTA
jgi:hypothetical protein